MVGGLETFRDAFREYSDSFVIIGGTACEEVLQGPQQAKAIRGRILKINDFRDSLLLASTAKFGKMSSPEKS